MAVFTALALSACGKQAGEGEGNVTGTSAAAEGGINTGNPAMENRAVGTVNPEDGTGEIPEPEAIQRGTAGSADGAAAASGPESGKPRQDEGVVAQQEGDAGILQVTLPEGWIYELCPKGSDQLRTGDYGIHFYPEGVSEGFVELCYMEFFGVCGTGLEEKEMDLAGGPACIGIYDHHDYWDFVSFGGANKGIVALSYAVEDWWPEYGGQMPEILDTVRLIQNNGNGTGAAETMQTIACGTDQEPPEESGEDSVIGELGLSLEITEHTDTKAVLLFRQSGGNPTGELQCGSDFSLERYENETWGEVPVVVEGNYAFTSEAWMIPQDGDREFQIDWKWLYGELEPGEYRIVKSVDDFRNTGDYDRYRIYAYFEVYSITPEFSILQSAHATG